MTDILRPYLGVIRLGESSILTSNYRLSAYASLFGVVGQYIPGYARIGGWGSNTIESNLRLQKLGNTSTINTTIRMQYEDEINNRFYNLLPRIYRIRDIEQEYVLQRFLWGFSNEYEYFKRTAGALKEHNDIFKTPALTTLAKSIGWKVDQAKIDARQRLDVFSATSWYKRKGTTTGLTQFLRSLTGGWTIRVCEFRNKLLFSNKMSEYNPISNMAHHDNNSNVLTHFRKYNDIVSYTLSTRAKITTITALDYNIGDTYLYVDDNTGFQVGDVISVQGILRQITGIVSTDAFTVNEGFGVFIHDDTPVHLTYVCWYKPNAYAVYIDVPTMYEEDNLTVRKIWEILDEWSPSGTEAHLVFEVFEEQITGIDVDLVEEDGITIITNRDSIFDDQVIHMNQFEDILNRPTRFTYESIYGMQDIYEESLEV